MPRYDLTLQDEFGGTCIHNVGTEYPVKTPGGAVYVSDLEVGHRVVVDGYVFTITDKQEAQE